jgi:hypothetical protein
MPQITKLREAIPQITKLQAATHQIIQLHVQEPRQPRIPEI